MSDSNASKTANMHRAAGRESSRRDVAKTSASSDSIPIAESEPKEWVSCRQSAPNAYILTCLHIFCFACLSDLMHYADRGGLDEVGCSQCGGDSSSAEPCGPGSDLSDRLRKKLAGEEAQSGDEEDEGKSSFITISEGLVQKMSEPDLIVKAVGHVDGKLLYTTEGG